MRLSEQKVPVQSLIDHIKTAVDVDPWAKEMAEELLKKREPMKVKWYIGRAHCPSCGELFPRKKETQYIQFCSFCGQKVEWE